MTEPVCECKSLDCVRQTEFLGEQLAKLSLLEIKYRQKVEELELLKVERKEIGDACTLAENIWRKLREKAENRFEDLLKDWNIRNDITTEWANRAEKAEKELSEAKAALSGRTVSCSNCNQLAKELERMEQDRILRLDGSIPKDLYGHFVTTRGKLEKAEANLTKAREALENIRFIGTSGIGENTEARTAREALSEISEKNNG